MKYFILISIAGTIIALDQLTKMYIYTYFHVGESVAIIPDFFNITSVRNPGAAFGFLAETEPIFRETFFMILPPFALLIIILILRKVASNDIIQIIALSLIFGGAVGNYIDRIRFQHVIDFLDFHFKHYYTWPAFNVADICIVSGICIFILLMIRDAKEEFKKEQKP